MPFIFVSGAIGEEVAIDTLKRGATDYVLKDRLSRLVPAVKRALREAADRRERLQAEAALRESEQRYRLLVRASQPWSTGDISIGRRTLLTTKLRNLPDISKEEFDSRRLKWSRSGGSGRHRPQFGKAFWCVA